jgi:hypothetical protein
MVQTGDLLPIIVAPCTQKASIFLVKGRTNTVMRECCAYRVIKLSSCPESVIELCNQTYRRPISHFSAC